MKEYQIDITRVERGFVKVNANSPQAAEELAYEAIYHGDVIWNK